MAGPLDIVLLEQSPVEFQLIERELDRGEIPHATHWAKDEDDFGRMLRSGCPEVILTNTSLPREVGAHAVKMAHEVRPDVPIIILSDPAREGDAIEALRHGATDYVLKNRLERLGPVVSRAADEFHARHAHREALRKLSEQEAFYHSLVENIPLNIFRKDLLGRFTFVNQRFADLLGKTVEQTLGRSDYDFFPEEFAFKYRADDQRIIGSGEVFETVEENRKEDGNRAFVHVIKVPLSDAHGKRIGLQGIFWDITKAREDAEAVHQQADLLDRVQDAIIVIGFDGKVTFWNQGAKRLYDWSAKEARGRDLVELLGLDPYEFERARDRVGRKDGWTGEVRQVTKDGSEVIADSHWSIVRDRQGEPQSIIIINSDATEKVRLKNDFLRAQRMEGVGSLASGLAHDLNNVLAPILMSAQMFRSGLEGEEMEEVVQTIENCAERGALMLRQLLAFGRGAEGQREVVQPRLLMEEMAKIMRETFPKDVQVSDSYADDLWTTMGDATQIHQVLLNLMVNARDAMPDGGAIRMSAENAVLNNINEPGFPDAQDGPYVVITVSDTGEGIPHEVREKIFDPFFSTKTRDKGTGLGLSTTMGIVKGHRGFIRMESRPAKGTTFRVFLPAGDAEGTRLILRQDVSADAGHLPDRVLLVDDEPGVLLMLKRILGRSGVEVVTAKNGVEALAELERPDHGVQLIITDIDMPEMNGMELVARLREGTHDTPIVVSTGLNTDEKIRPLLEQMGIREFLVKPYAVNSLLTSMKRAMSPLS